MFHIIRDKETGLERHYKMNLDFRFVEVRHVLGDDRVLNPDMLEKIADNLHRITRTDPNVAKHKGLTMFYLDMRSPGVTIKPNTPAQPNWSKTVCSVDKIVASIWSNIRFS